MKLDAKVAYVARDLINAERQRFAAYDEVVADYRRQGYRPARCIHGRYLWGESDIPCGACEDGEGQWDYLRVAGWALFEAKRRYAEYKRRQEAWFKIWELDVSAPGLAELVPWVSAPLNIEERV